MTTFAEDEASVEAQPREFYEIIQSSNVTYRIAQGERDIVYDGNTYTASAVARTDLGVSTISGEVQPSVVLPLAHPLCQRYLAQASPPRQVQVTIFRKQLVSGEVQTIWRGLVTSMAIDGHTGKFLVQSLMSRSLDRLVPWITVGNNCPYILYDSNCTIDDAGFKVTTTVVRFDGRRLYLATVGAFGDENFALFGDIEHVATGERQTVMSEDGPAVDGTTAFDIQTTIPGLAVGDSVVVRAGCLHDIATCFGKFNNRQNYGGFPELPSSNIFLQNSSVWGRLP